MRESGDYFFEFEGTSGGPCRELVFEFKSPPVNAACALLLLLVMAEAVAEASRTRRPGGSHWRAWSSFRFSPSKSLLIINLSLQSQFGPPRINKNFRFLAK